VVTSGSDAPELTRALVADGVDVHEVATGERTLEEVFFEMTKRELEAV
jgi:ABC-2 type transport system ATP-binding protein